MDQWDDIRFFLAIAREQSLSGAARALNVDHATVGRRLTAFERRLSAKLFNRTPEGFAITSAGQAILNQAEGMEAAALAVDRLASGQDTRSSGLVRLTTLEMLAHQVIAPALAILLDKHPQLQIELLIGLPMLDVARRQADIAVRTARPTDSNLICRKLGEWGVTAYASRRYLAAHGRPKRGAGLRGHSLIKYPITPPSFGKPFHGESLEGARIAMHTTGTAFVQIRAVEHGIGIGELPCCLADENPELERVWPNERPAMRPVWMVIHQDLRRAARIRLVSNAIVEAFERNAAILRYGRPRKRRYSPALT
ncbi:MAG TPA: LysR family transcriptional regulator [Candidatus Binatus sp.]|nr:LysR family transcriptional regulator [Candidatus Binatus sp.]